MSLSFTDDELLARAKKLGLVAEDATGPLSPRARKTAAISVAQERDPRVRTAADPEPLVVHTSIVWRGRTVAAHSFSVPISEEPT